MMIFHYFSVAWRSLSQYKVYTVLSVVCLAFGMMFFSGMYRFASGAASGVMSLPGADRMVYLTYMTSSGDDTFHGFTYAELTALDSMKLPGVERIIAWHRGRQKEMVVEQEGGQEQVHILRSRALYGDLNTDFQGRLLYGDRLPRRSDEVVLSASAARKICGKASPVGLLLRDVVPQPETVQETFRVVNVVEDFDLGTEWKADLYLMCPETLTASWSNVCMQLKPGCDVERLAGLMAKCLAGNRWVEDGDVFKLRPIRIRYTNPVMDTLLALAVSISSLVLVSGLICFLVFVVYRFYNRQRELALRKMMGARPAGLSMLLFVEIAMVLTAAFLFSLSLAELATDGINDIVRSMGDIVPLRSAGDVMLTEAWVYVALLVLCLVIVQIPVWRMRRSALGGYVVRNRRRYAVRNVLLGIQLIISTFLVGGLVGLFLLVRFLEGNCVHSLTEDEEQHVVRVELKYRIMQQRSKEIKAALNERMRPVKVLDLYNSYMTTCGAGGGNYLAWVYETTPDYFDFFRIPVRYLTTDTTGLGGVFVCEKLYDVLLQSGESTVNLGGTPYPVAGVYPEIYYGEGMWDSNYGDAYSALLPTTGEATSFTCYLRLPDTDDPDEALLRVRQICREFVPGTEPLAVASLDDDDPNMMLYKLLLTLAMLLSAASLLLAVMGIYTAISMDTAGRQKEMALRKVYGASAWHIARRFLRLYAVLLAVALVVTMPVLVVFFDVVFGTPEFTESLLTLLWPLLVLAVMIACVAVSVYTRIRQIIHVNPVEFIRTE